MNLTDGIRWSDLALNCIEECLLCYVTCRRTYENCTGQKYPRQTDLFNSLLECAEICHATEACLCSGSELWDTACNLCAECCKKCARECKRVAGVERLRICRETCEECAATCRRLVATAKAFSGRIPDIRWEGLSSPEFGS